MHHDASRCRFATCLRCLRIHRDFPLTAAMTGSFSFEAGVVPLALWHDADADDANDDWGSGSGQSAPAQPCAPRGWGMNCVALLCWIQWVKWQESYKVGEHGVVLEAILELMAHESHEWHFFPYRTWSEMNARLKWIYLQEVWGRQQATISTVASTHGKDFNFVGVAVPVCPAN